MTPVLQHLSDTLPNGLRIVTVEMPHLHTVTVQLYVKVGSRFETRADNGLSHFLEHMLFRGTDSYPSSYELNFAIERLGGTLDAETGRDCSMYPLSIAPELLDEALLLLAEVVGRPRFDDIELERQIILEELNEDFDEDGVEISADEIGRRLIFGDHPLGFRITGPRENVERFGLDDLRRHHGRFYVASNMVLAVAGPVEGAKVRAMAAAHFGRAPAGQLAEETSPSFDQTEPRYEFAGEPGSQTSVSFVFRALAELDPDYMASLALLRVLDDGMSTRLHYQLCDQLGLAYSIGAGLEPLYDVTLLEIEGTTSHAKLEQLMGRTLGLLEQLRDTPCEPEELDKVKRRYRHDLAASRDEPYSMAAWFGGTALYRSPPSLQARLDQMEAVTAEDVRRVAGRIFRRDRFAAVVVGGLDRPRQRTVRSLLASWR